MSALPVLPGDPDAVRLLADRLASTARRLSAIAAVLVRLRDGATWDGPAGDAFAVRLHEVTPVLDAVAVRLGSAAEPLRRFADALAQAQQVVALALRDDADAEHAHAVLEDRAWALVSAGSTEQSPDLLVVRHLQREQVEVRGLALARHTAAAESFREADRRCAVALTSMSVDGLTDSLTYRAVVGASSLGHDLSSLGPVATVVPWLRPVAAVGDLTGLAADGALLVGYGEGDAGALAVGAALAATGVTAGTLRRGAVAGARQTPSGVVVTRTLTTQERLRLGALAEVRKRRDDLRRQFSVAPGHGAPSTLVTRPPQPPRAAASPSWRPTSVAAVRATVDARVVRARALASAKVDAAFLSQWRLATANGPGAQRMYVAGATLEGATRAGERAAGSAGGEEDRPRQEVSTVTPRR